VAAWATIAIPPARGHRKSQDPREAPQSNAIVERFHRTLLDEHFRVEGRRTRFDTVQEMEVALDIYLVTHKTSATDRGADMNGRTFYRAFLGPAKETHRRTPTANPIFDLQRRWTTFCDSSSAC
jgi:hypothetical protein